MIKTWVKIKVNHQKEIKSKKITINKSNNYNQVMGLINFKVKFKMTTKFPIKKDNNNQWITAVIYLSYLIVIIKYHLKTTKANYLNKKIVK
jgi:hypothetical protein